MRTGIASEYVTLDGVMEDQYGWSFQLWNEEAAKFKGQIIRDWVRDRPTG
ncbi:MAG: hypothetical protein WBE34_18945 [Candidatus Nitrosopolaris sp.]|jgi:hypothetical protein